MVCCLMTAFAVWQYLSLRGALPELKVHHKYLNTLQQECLSQGSIYSVFSIPNTRLHELRKANNLRNHHLPSLLLRRYAEPCQKCILSHVSMTCNLVRALVIERARMCYVARFLSGR